MKFSRTQSMMRAEDIPKRQATINNQWWMNNDVKQAIGKRQRAYETKRRNSLQLGEKLKEL